tara:strand:- start:2060 stop:2455 length:396 start_codon:yes stop_codon:yes gene_type:complete
MEGLLEKQQEKEEFEFSNERDLHLYFQTTIRNVALTTAVSIAVLGYSRYYRGKNYTTYNILLVLSSLILLSISFFLNISLLKIINRHNNSNTYISIFNFKFVNYMAILLHFILIGLCVTTFYRSLFMKDII